MIIDRELWKNGRRIICYIETVEDDKGIGFIVKTGKPSDATCLSWRYGNYKAAEEQAYSYFYGVVSLKKNQTLTIV